MALPPLTSLLLLRLSRCGPLPAANGAAKVSTSHPQRHIMTSRPFHRTFSSTTSKPSSSPFKSYIVTPLELLSALKSTSTPPSSAIIPLSAAWFMPNDPHHRTPLSAFTARRIPSARLFNLDAIADTASPYPHMLPSPTDFASAMSALGIAPSNPVVVYDDPDVGLFSAPRVAWTLRVFGHSGGVHVLNSFKRWCEEGLPTAEGGPVEEYEAVEYAVPEMNEGLVARFEDVKMLAEKALNGGGEGQRVQILDARSEGRWSGRDPEPRAGLSSGHVPGSLSVPFTELLDGKTKALKNARELRAVFEGRGVDLQAPIVASCGTGVTAAVIDAALKEVGVPEGKTRLYDGSWTEWAQRVSEGEGLIVKGDK